MRRWLSERLFDLSYLIDVLARRVAPRRVVLDNFERADPPPLSSGWPIEEKE